MKENIGMWIAIGFMVLQFGVLFGRFVYTRYIRPFISYKLVVMDTDDVYEFYKKKRHLQIVEDQKGFILFERKKKDGSELGEFYSIPLEQEKDKHLSKRDDAGSVTYFFFRNQPEPISIDPVGGITTTKNASLLGKVLKTNMLDAALSLRPDEKPMPFRTKLLIGVALVLVVLAVIFKDQLAVMLG